MTKFGLLEPVKSLKDALLSTKFHHIHTCKMLINMQTKMHYKTIQWQYRLKFTYTLEKLSEVTGDKPKPNNNWVKVKKW